MIGNPDNYYDDPALEDEGVINYGNDPEDCDIDPDDLALWREIEADRDAGLI